MFADMRVTDCLSRAARIWRAIVRNPQYVGKCWTRSPKRGNLTCLRRGLQALCPAPGVAEIEPSEPASGDICRHSLCTTVGKPVTILGGAAPGPVFHMLCLPRCGRIGGWLAAVIAARGCSTARGRGDVPAKPPHGIVGDYVAKPAHQERREPIALLATAAFWSILVWCLALAWIANKDEGCDGCTANFERDIRWALLKTEARTVARAEAPRGAD